MHAGREIPMVCIAVFLYQQNRKFVTSVYQPDFSRMIRPPEAENYTCPEGRLVFNNGRIRLDPTFYDYRYCICDADRLGGLCFQCKKGDQLYYYMFIPVFAVSFLALIWSYFYFNVRPLKWFVVAAIHFLVMLIMMLLEFLPAWVFKLNMVVFVLCMTSRGKAARTLISIAVFYIQTIDFMVSSFSVWPKKVISLMSVH